MKFRLKADIEFEAENIDDAFIQLAEYFKSISLGKDDGTWYVGEINIFRSKDEENVYINKAIKLSR